jgi:hypothetical protein
MFFHDAKLAAAAIPPAFPQGTEKSGISRGSRPGAEGPLHQVEASQSSQTNY